MKAGTLLRGMAGVGTSLLGLLVLTFFIGRVMPLDPVLAVVGPDADQSTYNQVREQMGLDQPLVVQFWRYLQMLAQGDLEAPCSPVTRWRLIWGGCCRPRLNWPRWPC